jgi:hypothetical protein
MQGIINHFSQFIKIDSTKSHLQIVTVLFGVQYWRTIVYTLRQIVQNNIIQVIYLRIVTNQSVQSKCEIFSLAYFVTISLIIWILSFACLLTTLLLLVAPFIVAPILWTTIFFMEYVHNVANLRSETITHQLLYRPTINSWPTILPNFCLQPWWVCIQNCVSPFFFFD